MPGVAVLIGIGGNANANRCSSRLIRAGGRLDGCNRFANFFGFLFAAFALEPLHANLLLVAAMIAEVERSILIRGGFANKLGRGAIVGSSRGLKRQAGSDDEG